MNISNLFGKRRNAIKGKRTLGDILFAVIFIVLLFYSAMLVGLLFWGLISTFKDYYTDFAQSNASGFPKRWVFSNYKQVFGEMYWDVTTEIGDVRVNAIGLIQYTLLYTLGCAFFSTLSPCLVGYAVAKFGKKYSFLNVYTSIVIVCMIIPIVGNLPSEMQIAMSLGLYDSIFGMWIMKAHFLSMYYLVFLGAFRSMPDGYAEAAKIDGAGNFLVFIKIYFPLAIKTFFTVMLIQAITFWNDYQTPLLYLETYPTLAYWLYRFTENTGTESFVPVKVAGSMVLIIPMLVLFVAFNKRIMGNMSLGGLKE